MEFSMCELVFLCVVCMCLGALSGSLFALLNVRNRRTVKKDKKVDKVSQNQIDSVSVRVRYED